MSKKQAYLDLIDWLLPPVGTAEKLDKLGIAYERKGPASFQITVNGRVGMYYDGKKGEQIRWNDGEVQHGALESILDPKLGGSDE